MNAHCLMPDHGKPDAPSACCRPPVESAPPAATQHNYRSPVVRTARGAVVWRAAQNTAICLLGCSLGDVGVVMASWVWFPQAPMWLVMIAAIIAGLVTSILLETAWLMRRGHAGAQAIALAFSMSFISMVAMETAMNLVDLGLTGGNRMHLTMASYLGILALGEVAGFLVPLPYNVWRLRRGRSCH